MADSYLNFAKQETEQLDMEIEVLQGEIRLHDETKEAWDTILRNAGSASQAACMDIANSEKERLSGEVEAVQEKIHFILETRSAWDTIMRNSGSESRIYQDTTYVRSEDGQWHLQRLNGEIEVLQGEICLHNQTKDAWNAIIRNARSESHATCLDFAKFEAARLNGRIEAVQEKIRRRIETRDAWDTIMRNAGSELRTYRGAAYERGEDGQWHLLLTQASESNGKGQEKRGDRRRTAHTASKSVLQKLLDACESTFPAPQKDINLPTRGKEQFQSLGL